MPQQPEVIGRFAPSPTGPLHLGSLYAALGSFLEARSQQGRWLLRIDDLDIPRNVKGADSLILTTLDRFGLHWDGAVMYQSQNSDSYQQLLRQLEQQALLYPCICSRKILGDQLIYPGTCRHLASIPDQASALRIKTLPIDIGFDDSLQGAQSSNLADQHGDFILKRKDGIIAYQFAVVVDDYLQQVNHVVRGVDLLEVTPRQIYLQQALGLATPRYSHLPIIADKHGNKLSKQTKAQAVDLTNPQQTLFHLLQLLKQNPPAELAFLAVDQQLAWATKHWQAAHIADIQTISLTIDVTK